MPPLLSPAWWPTIAVASPLLAPLAALAEARFRAERRRAIARNDERTSAAVPLELPELEYLEVTPLVEQEAGEGFRGDPGVSYWLKSDRGSVLFDVAFGGSRASLARNAHRLGFSLSSVDAVVISHPHPDHAGGPWAVRRGEIGIPPEIADAAPPCHATAPCTLAGRPATVVEGPRGVAAGLATTGRLARALFIEGRVEEQALVGRVRGKGTVVVTGCGHPGLDLLAAMARRIAPGRIHAIVGGLHLPITGSRWCAGGIALQRLFGTGKRPWTPPSAADLDRAVSTLDGLGLERLLISAHDSCDHAIARLRSGLSARVEVLAAGHTFRI